MTARSAFISYQRADIGRAAFLAGRLSEYGLKPWWDEAIAPGDDWRERIAAGLEQADLFIVLHSTAAEESAEVRKEIAAASALAKPLIAVRLEKRVPRGVFLYEMASLNWIDAYDDPDAALDRLARRLATARLDGSARAIGEAAGARPIAAPVFARMVGSSRLLACIWLASFFLGFASLEAMGEGVSSLATEQGATFTDIAYVTGAVTLGAPLLLLRFAMHPPSSIAEAGLLVSSLAILFAYAFLIRNFWRFIQRRIALGKAAAG